MVPSGYNLFEINPKILSTWKRIGVLNLRKLIDHKMWSIKDSEEEEGLPAGGILKIRRKITKRMILDHSETNKKSVFSGQINEDNGYGDGLVRLITPGQLYEGHHKEGYL